MAGFGLSKISSVNGLMLLVIATALMVGCNRVQQDASAGSQGIISTPTSTLSPPNTLSPSAGNSASGVSGMSGAAVNSATAVPIAGSGATPQTPGLRDHGVDPCSADEVSAFNRDDGERFDPLSLPTGLYVASTIQMFLEKSNSSGEPPSRALIREVVGGDKGVEIVCADGLEKFGRDFDFSITGLVKFVTNAQKIAGDIAFRQVFFYQNKLDTGAIVSNPQLTSQAFHAGATAGWGLTELLHHGGGQLYRLAESTYRIKYVRDRESGLHAKLVIDLDAN